MLFQQLTNADGVSNNAAMIDNFPERMERFLNCISQVYFEHESLDAIVTGNDKAAGKKLLRSSEYGRQQQQQQSDHSLPLKDMPGVDNWDHHLH